MAHQNKSLQIFEMPVWKQQHGKPTTDDMIAYNKRALYMYIHEVHISIQ
jgi:hypothetical protein